MLEVKHLKTLQALAKTHSVNQAAMELCMTQSALSHQIKQLEETLELELFKRKTHPIQLTPAGEILLHTAKIVLPKLDYAQRQLLALKQGESGRLWMGVDCHTCFEWLMPLLRPYQAQWPNVDLDIVPSFHESPLLKLPPQQLDFVITSDPEKLEGVDCTALFSYELVAVLPPNDPNLAKQILSAEDFAQMTLITYPVSEAKLSVFKEFLNPCGITPQAISYSELTLMMLQRVEAGRGVCVLPKWLVENQADFNHLPWRSLGEAGLWTKLYAATPHHLTQQPYIQALIQLIADRVEV